MSIVKIASREFRQILQDSRLRSVVLIAPFAYALLMSFVYINHSVTELPIAVYNKSDSAASRQLMRMVEASPKLDITSYVHSLEEIKHLMFARQIEGALVIPADFSNATTIMRWWCAGILSQTRLLHGK